MCYILMTLFSQTREMHSYKPSLQMWTRIAFSILLACNWKMTFTSIISAEVLSAQNFVTHRKSWVWIKNILSDSRFIETFLSLRFLPNVLLSSIQTTYCIWLTSKNKNSCDLPMRANDAENPQRECPWYVILMNKASTVHLNTKHLIL